MANEELVERLRESVEEWNTWREGNGSDEKIDLSGADLRGAQLEHADLSSADLRGADLAFTNLYNANLADADLLNTQIYQAELWGVNLRDADLRGADLRGAELCQADLSNAKMSGARLGEADLWRANLSRANLSRADLREANLTETTLVETNLFLADCRRARFSGADLGEANLIDANFHRAEFGKTSIRNRTKLSYGYALHEEPILKVPPATLKGATLGLFNRGRINGNDLAEVRFSPHSKDEWSIARRNYTGLRLLFHVVFLFLFFTRYASRLVPTLLPNASGIEGDEFMVWQVILGWDKGFWAVVTSLFFLAYNLIRAVITWHLAPVRDNEERTQIAPEAKSYVWCFHLHHYFMRWAFFLAMASFLYHFVPWMTSTVTIPHHRS